MTPHNKVDKTTLPNGLRIVSESLPDRDSVAIGVWVEVGSRHEDDSVAGVSHFLEHMVFKGTPGRSPKDIALALECLGGVLNAFTSREHTCFHARVLEKDLPIAVDILADLSTRATLPASEVLKERKVIAEEIKDVHDTPHEYVHDLFAAQMWPGHPIGRPIAGTIASVEQTTRDKLHAHRAFYYRPDRILVAASGALSHRRLVQLVRKHFDSDVPEKSFPTFRAPNGLSAERRVTGREINQTHVCLGVPTWAFSDKRRYQTLVFSTLLGGGMSSRLFQSVREKHGLVYSIYAFNDSFQDTGFFAVYFACDPTQVVNAANLVLTEIGKIARTSVPPREVRDAKEQLKGNLLLGLESTSSRMHRLARHELYLGRHITPKETMNAIDRVRTADLTGLVREAFDENRTALTVLGPVKNDILAQLDWDQLRPRTRRVRKAAPVPAAETA